VLNGLKELADNIDVDVRFFYQSNKSYFSRIYLSVQITKKTRASQSLPLGINLHAGDHKNMA